MEMIERENWAKKSRSKKHSRNTPPRLQEFVQKFAKKVHKLRKGRYKESEVKEMTEDIRIFNNITQSRFEAVHGPVGLGPLPQLFYPS